MIENELARIHARRIKPIKKALESVISSAAKKNCWYDPWNRRGDRADWSILHEKVEAFIKEADVEDILPMVDFLLEKAKRQIEHSNDEGDSAGQARYWAQKLIKAAVKKNCNHIFLIDWAIGIIPKDIYFLTNAEEIVLEKNKVPTQEIWSEVANHYEKTNRQVYLMALQKAGRMNERKALLKKSAKQKKDYAYLVEDALLRGDCEDALKICEQGMVQLKGDKFKIRELNELAARIETTQGRQDREFNLRMERLNESESLEDYKSLLELATVLNKSEHTRDEILKKLEAAQKWRLLLKIALHEYKLLDAAKYYWLTHEKSSGSCCGYDPFKQDFDLATRLAYVYPNEAVKILQRIVNESLAAYQPMYDYVVRALSLLKSIFLVSGKIEELMKLLQSLRTKHPRKRNLLEIIERL